MSGARQDAPDGGRPVPLCSPRALARGRWVICIEGMGGYDRRDAAVVARRVADNLLAAGVPPGPDSPALVVTQGDPAGPRGIAAVTRGVAQRLGLERSMAVLDPELDPEHARRADRQGIRSCIRYGALAAEAARLPAQGHGQVLALVEEAVRAGIEARNLRRAELGKAPLAEHFPRFARLQELTKIVLRRHADRLLVAHTAARISPFSVTSFCEVGLGAGLVAPEDMVAFGEDLAGACGDGTD